MSHISLINNVYDFIKKVILQYFRQKVLPVNQLMGLRPTIDRNRTIVISRERLNTSLLNRNFLLKDLLVIKMDNLNPILSYVSFEKKIQLGG